MPIEFAKLSSQKIRELVPSKTVFFFPVGPIEDHGPHLPLGLDIVEAARVSALCAEKLEQDLAGWTGVVMPAAPLGLEGDTSALAITVRPHVLRDYLVDSCRALIAAGFRQFVCVSGHLGPKQLTAIEEAGKIVSGGNWLWRLISAMRGRPRPTLVSASSILVSPKAVKVSPFWPDPVEHGGARDTSVALSVAKPLVDPIFATLPSRPREGSHWTRGLRRARRRLYGYWGAPAEASFESGDRVLQAEVEAILPKLRAVLGGANPNHVFRSWYSVFPPNKSFFKAWLLALFLILLIIVTMLASMRLMR